MTTINATNARKMLYGIIDDVNNSHEPIHITSKKGDAVLISEEDWRSIEETIYLNNIPNLAKSIKNGLRQSLDDCSDTLNW